ncbi:hypothetical protein DPMN_052491 [Dreissena polymorpha]|uniref:Secreted protein n=1 Tax=Dreissena polymorpha TaxID=45954 RepID=A0A9D4CLL1_DREPO|nr:hypothetical protein DPMN_052491 [Dreissena polymorpha]
MFFNGIYLIIFILLYFLAVGPTANCKSTNTTKNGWGSCRIQGAGKTSGTQVNLGSPTDDLKRDKTGRLVLTYQTDPSDPKPPGCTSPPTTTLVFICPSRGQVHFQLLFFSSL